MSPGSKLYLFGGATFDDEIQDWVRYDDMFEFDLENYTWSEISDVVQSRPAPRFEASLM